MPLDALIYTKNSLHIPDGKRITDEDPYFMRISKQWSDTLRNGLQELPNPSEDYFK
jgi:putative proteasome-type protease